MRRKLLVIAMVTTMVASTLLVGCGGSDTSEATTKASVEQNNNNDNKVEDSTKDTSKKEDTTSKKEEVKGYDEVFYEEPNWEVEYEGQSELFIETMKLEYDAMKFVFEDMTRRFKNKEEVTATDEIWIVTSNDRPKTFVCDIDNVMVEGLTNSDGEPIVWKKDLYPEFAGFNLKDIDASYRRNEGTCRVDIKAPYVDGQCPLSLTVYVVKNDDGTYTYKSISVGSNNYE